MTWSVKEFKEETDTEREFILLFPKGQGQCSANQYKGKKEDWHSRLKAADCQVTRKEGDLGAEIEQTMGWGGVSLKT